LSPSHARSRRLEDHIFLRGKNEGESDLGFARRQRESGLVGGPLPEMIGIGRHQGAMLYFGGKHGLSSQLKAPFFDVQKKVKAKPMTVTISIPDDVANKLHERAAASGQAVPVYASQLVEQAVRSPTLEELLAPVQADFARGGMTEDQLIELGRNLLHEVRATKED
jgi:hypothetical protein